MSFVALFVFDTAAVVGGSVLLGMQYGWKVGVAAALIAYYVKPVLKV